MRRSLWALLFLSALSACYLQRATGPNRPVRQQPDAETNTVRDSVRLPPIRDY